MPVAGTHAGTLPPVVIETPRFVTEAAVESRHNQADEYGRAIDAHADVEAVVSSRDWVCRELEPVNEETTESIVGVSRHDVEHTINHHLKRAGGNEDDNTPVPDGDQFPVVLAAIDEGDQATLPSEAKLRAVTDGEAGA